MSRYGRGAIVALGLISSGFAQTAFAASDADLAEIRKQIDVLNQRRLEDATRIHDLEERLAKAEAATKTASADAQRAAAAATQALNTPPPAPPSSANAFNPAISGVLDGKLGGFSKDPATYAMAGFPLGGEGPGQRGLFLGEAELNAQANVDDLFMGSLTFSLGQNGPDTEVGLEEAFIQTLSLPGGFQATAGKFLSDIGYLNSFHDHADDFADRPLAYRAFLAGGLVDVGARLTWLAPTETYLRFGAEVMRGESFPAANAVHDGFGAKSAYMRAGDDIGTEISYQTGVSWLWSDAANRETTTFLGALPDAFTGKTDVGIAHLVVKWAPNGNAVNRNLKFQAEVLRNHTDGIFNGLAVDRTDYGAYGQLIYQFKPQWRVGYRFDWMSPGSVSNALALSTLDARGHDANRSTAMLEYDHSEFSRIRLQYSYDRSRLFGVADHEFLLQYTATIGAHPAHSY
ncbi:MAG: hypothetical protein ACYCZX_12700 [Rhodospirillaceae bacterium]